MSDSKIIIEENIPLPDSNRGANTKYPWDNLQVGDSFFIECNAISIPAKASLQRQAVLAGRKYDKKFATRSVANGLRIWRTS